MSRRSSKIFPRFIAAALAVPALAGAALLAAPTAFAVTTETGPDGQELTVSQTALEPEGSKVTVSGTGFREDVGIRSEERRVGKERQARVWGCAWKYRES